MGAADVEANPIDFQIKLRQGFSSFEWHTFRVLKPEPRQREANLAPQELSSLECTITQYMR